MADTGGSARNPPSEAPWRPHWWWFLIHGSVVGAWGLFALISPWHGAEGWLLDGIAYGVMLLLAGSQLIVQGLGWRRHSKGWLGMFLGGVVAVVFAGACFVAGALGDADAMFWVVAAFLAIEGAVFILGTSAGFQFRFWGALMGGVIYVALVLLLVLRFTIDRHYVILDPLWGSLGLLYGIAVITAAVQVRHAGMSRAGGAAAGPA